MADPVLQASNGNGPLERPLPAPAPKLRRSEVYARPLLDGASPRTGVLSRARDRVRSLTTSSLEREELELEGALRAHGEVTQMWRLNDRRIRSGDPDLIFPGEGLEVPRG